MAIHTTINHDTIRRWIEERGGSPVVVAGSPAEASAETLSIRFDENPDLEPVGWEEFFDMLDTVSLAFRYDDAAAKGNSDLAYNFIPRDMVDSLDRSEAALPEDNDMARENMFPSAPPDREEYGPDRSDESA